MLTLGYIQDFLAIQMPYRSDGHILEKDLQVMETPIPRHRAPCKSSHSILIHLMLFKLPSLPANTIYLSFLVRPVHSNPKALPISFCT